MPTPGTIGVRGRVRGQMGGERGGNDAHIHRDGVCRGTGSSGRAGGQRFICADPDTIKPPVTTQDCFAGIMGGVKTTGTGKGTADLKQKQTENKSPFPVYVFFVTQKKTPQKAKKKAVVLLRDSPSTPLGATNGQ